MRRTYNGPIAQPSVGGGQRISGRTHPVVPLQRAIGNRATTQLLRKGKDDDGAGAKNQSARSFTVKIKGEKQGDFKGDGSGKIKGRKYHFGVKAPTDVATGHASGKRQYQAITFHKDMDAASPELLEALANNENLPEVTFEFSQPTDAGATEVFEVVKLTNARLTAVDQDMDDGDGDEVVSLVFEKISMDNQPGKTSASDDWKANP